MPYEEITKEDYDRKIKRIHELKLEKAQVCLRHVQNEVVHEPLPENYCDADKCKI